MRNEAEIKEKIKNERLVIYLDECAAGVLGGDLFICGLIIEKEKLIKLLEVNDSKKLSEKKRASLFPKIVELATDFEIVRLVPSEVDRLNIFNARMQGFLRAIEILSKRNSVFYAIIDGNKKPENTPIETDFLVKADAILPGVSCASIVAKHSHTKYIEELCENPIYDRYGLKSHKGYGTKLHLEKLAEYGPLENFHRFSYQPVKDSIRY